MPFVVFLIAGTAELNRPPFDLVEAEQELVGGFHTEYSSIRFALFFLAEFMNTVTMSAIIVTLFFGGPSPLFDIPFVDFSLVVRGPALVRVQAEPLPVHVRLVPGHASPHSLRPADGSRLEAAHSPVARLAARARGHPRRPRRKPRGHRRFDRRHDHRDHRLGRRPRYRWGSGHQGIEERTRRPTGRCRDVCGSDPLGISERPAREQITDGIPRRIRRHVQEVGRGCRHQGVPRRNRQGPRRGQGSKSAQAAAGPRSSRPEPLRRRYGEVHRLRVLRRCLSGEVHLRPRRRQSGRRTTFAR